MTRPLGWCFCPRLCTPPFCPPPARARRRLAWRPSTTCGRRGCTGRAPGGRRCKCVDGAPPVGRVAPPHLRVGGGAPRRRVGRPSVASTPLDGLPVVTRAGDGSAVEVCPLRPPTGPDEAGAVEPPNGRPEVVGARRAPVVGAAAAVAATVTGGATASLAGAVSINGVRWCLGAYLLRAGGDPHALVVTTGVGRPAL
eukprot:TRINITY_DN13308_c0_g1_i1.p2 TRINITY_DN13308_c0_g1~~TRINITY_DN13308_c0_g1_i1.p2  ORF type:complete len:197 (-),score=40.42 TRINITY_DN13308_c0_g1_i1:99-689(-)